MSVVGGLECVVCVGCSRWAWKRLNYVGAYDSESWPLSSPARCGPCPRPRSACAMRACAKRAPAPRASSAPERSVPPRRVRPRRVRRRARGPARRSVRRRPCAPKRARAPQGAPACAARSPPTALLFAATTDGELLIGRRKLLPQE
uniref:Mono-/di-acylglycerol lipase N-terminal domain-containing protein n=1 Tax=Ananas comosus var. bracteatus TaxID=296719 RepID=A0A6V7Q859_ANACO|nr:unnamed protein product [Ananas comosus var. bracteatus]